MPSTTVLSPQEVWDLMAAGHRYLDVRSHAEFCDGHIPGAFNVALLLEGSAGALDPDFVARVSKLFAKGEPIVVGCQSGQRSKIALALLIAAEFSQVSEMSAGFGGSRDTFGRLRPGWEKCGLPVETGETGETGPGQTSA